MKSVQEFITLLENLGFPTPEQKGNEVNYYGKKNSVVNFKFHDGGRRRLIVDHTADYFRGRCDEKVEEVLTDVSAYVQFWAGKTTSDSGGLAGTVWFEEQGNTELRRIGRFLQSGNRSILHR